jgi:hypothetical protein
MDVDHMTLTELEKYDWGLAPDQNSYVERLSYDLRHKPLGEMTAEDLRLLIGQGIGLIYLVPRAVALLQHDLLINGMHYPGDLLINMLRLPPSYLHQNPDAKEQIRELCKRVPYAMQGLDEIDKRCFKEAFEEALSMFTREDQR